MARSEGRLFVELWEDRDFLSLTGEAQRYFMFLISQQDLAHSGVIALRERRWSRKSADGSVAGVETALKELDAARFIVIDWDAEELLIRSLIRRDRIYRQPNVMRAAVDHVPLIQSLAILRALVSETDRILVENKDLTSNQAGVVMDMATALAKRVGDLTDPEPNSPTGNPTVNPSGKGSGMPSADPSAEVPGVRGEITARTTSIPLPRENSPNPGTPSATPRASALHTPSTRPAVARFDELMAVYPLKDGEAEARKAWVDAIKRDSPDAIIAGAIRYRDWSQRSALHTKRLVNWLKNDCWKDPLIAAVPPPTSAAQPAPAYYQPLQPVRRRA